MIALAILALFVGIFALALGMGYFITSLVGPEDNWLTIVLGYAFSAVCLLLMVFAVHRIH